MSDSNQMQDGAPFGVSEVGASTARGGASEGRDGKPGKPETEVQVHCDYISADDPIHRKFSTDTVLSIVKEWARAEFVPNPPSDKAYYLNDDKTRHRFTAEEEQRTLAQLGYEHGPVHLRLNEEQASGA